MEQVLPESSPAASRAPMPQPAPIVPPASPKKTSIIKLLIVVIILGLLAGVIVVAYTFITNERVQKEQAGESISTIGLSVNDNFDNPVLNEELWFPWAISESSSVTIKEGMVQIEIIPGHTEDTSAGLDLFPLIEGDFEAEVDAVILSGGYPLGSETALIFHNDVGDWVNQIVIFLRKEEDGVYVRTARNVNGNYENLDFFKTYDYAGPFTIKMARQGGRVTFSVKRAEDTSFDTLGVLSSDFYQGRGRITLHVNTWGDNFPAVVSGFDNFRLKQM